MGEDFDDLVARARHDRTVGVGAESLVEENAVLVVAEVERIGRDAARHLTEGGVVTVPIIEFAAALVGGVKVVERGRAWVLASGVLRADGVFLQNLPVTGGEIVGDESAPDQARKARALRKVRIGEHDPVIVAPVVPALGRTVNGIVTLWHTQVNFLPINDGALSLSPLEGYPQRRTLAGTPRFAELIAREVAALLDGQAG